MRPFVTPTGAAIRATLATRTNPIGRVLFNG